ncbi:translation initiation factor IF-2-like [Phacochoerus africanus]|uniref:translation initiation factor IF-2-like n=1 Tax=Phacochoerus africanus TaxID=41426 RepID=UPI001FDAC1E6|nr:translation initiation factor IF-2-like [Phacochoerus africanus]
MRAIAPYGEIYVAGNWGLQPKPEPTCQPGRWGAGRRRAGHQVCEAVPLTQRLGPTASANRADPGPGSIRPSLPTPRSPRSGRHLPVSSPTSLPHRKGPATPARPGVRGGVGRREERGIKAVLGCRARGRAPLTAAKYQNQNPDFLRETSGGYECGAAGATAATPALPASGGEPEGAPEGAAGSNSAGGGVGGKNASQFSGGRRSRPPCPPGLGLGPPAPGWVSVGSHRPRGMKRVRRGRDPAGRPPPPPSAAGPTALPHSRAAGAGPAWNLTPRAGASPRGLGVDGRRSPGLPELGSESTARLVTFYELQIK